MDNQSSHPIKSSAKVNKKTRHILALSGGKDSSALAIYLLDKVPDMEYVFCDTEKELRETYEYLQRLETILGKKVQKLKYSDGYGFDEILKMKHGYLPSPQSRWCTEYLKLKPYEDYIGNDSVVSYVGIRADESHRSGYLSKKPNIATKFPFIENNICREDVITILEDIGLGLPKYYKWRSRSGCYFCFFQQKIEWVGLLKNHPSLFEKAMKYEKYNSKTGERFTWVEGESLKELSNPQRITQIEENYAKRVKMTAFKQNQSLKDIFVAPFDDETCAICHL